MYIIGFDFRAFGVGVTREDLRQVDGETRRHPGAGGGMGPIHIPRVEILTRGSLPTAIVHYGR